MEGLSILALPVNANLKLLSFSLHKLDLSKLDLNGAILRNTNFLDTNIEGVKFGRVIESSMNNGPGYFGSDLNPGKFCDLPKRLNPNQIIEVLGPENAARKYLEDLQISSKDNKLRYNNIQKVLDVVKQLEKKIELSPSSNPEGSIGVPAVAKEKGYCIIS